MDIPRRFITTVMLRETPIDLIGVDERIMLKAPVLINANPVDIIVRVKETEITEEWKININTNPVKPIIDPAITGFRLPIFAIINPEIGANIKKTNINGRWVIE